MTWRALSVRPLDPAEADFFFVPIYGECFLFRETQRSGGAALDITARWYRYGGAG